MKSPLNHPVKSKFLPGRSPLTLADDYAALIEKYEHVDYTPDKEPLVREELRLVHERNFVNPDEITIVLKENERTKKVEVSIMHKDLENPE